MRLHTRLSISYGFLAALVLVGAAGSALGFHTLGTQIASVLGDNGRSVRASMRMLEALERQDSAVLAALLDPSRPPAGIETSERAFLEAAEMARGAIRGDRERELLRTIGERYQAYRQARDLLLTKASSGSLEAYEEGCFPAFEDVKTGVRDLLDLNHDAMMRTDREVEATATERAIGYATLTAIAIVSTGFLSRGLRRHVIDRLEDLRSVTEAVGKGDPHRRADEHPADELGLVGRELNRLLDANDELRGRSTARLAELHEILVALLEAERGGAAIVNTAGEIVATSLEDAATERAALAATALPATDSAVEATEVDGGGERFSCRLLLVGAGRPAGWILRPTTGDRSDQTPD